MFGFDQEPTFQQSWLTINQDDQVFDVHFYTHETNENFK